MDRILRNLERLVQAGEASLVPEYVTRYFGIFGEAPELVRKLRWIQFRCEAHDDQSLGWFPSETLRCRKVIWVNGQRIYCDDECRLTYRYAETIEDLVKKILYIKQTIFREPTEVDSILQTLTEQSPSLQVFPAEFEHNVERLRNVLEVVAALNIFNVPRYSTETLSFEKLAEMSNLREDLLQRKDIIRYFEEDFPLSSVSFVPRIYPISIMTFAGSGAIVVDTSSYDLIVPVKVAMLG